MRCRRAAGAVRYSRRKTAEYFAQSRVKVGETTNFEPLKGLWKRGVLSGARQLAKVSLTSPRSATWMRGSILGLLCILGLVVA
jgi:hypothetical protein